MKKAGVLTIHGIGKVSKNYAQGFLGSLKNMIGEDKEDIAFGSIYYQNTQQANEERIWKRYSNNKLDWREARKFLLFGIADATGLEQSKHDPDGNYVLAQLEIAKELQKIRSRIEHQWSSLPIRSAGMYFLAISGMHKHITRKLNVASTVFGNDRKLILET